MFYTVYKVTNKINGKIYIGTHKTKNINDDYMGSGKYLKRSIEKHGIENFEKQILFIYDNPKEMFKKEKELVDESFISEENTYNLKIGGFGGWDFINKDEVSRKEKNKRARETTNKILKEKYGEDFSKIFYAKAYKTRSERYPNLHSDNAKRGHEEGWFSFKGKKHSDETKLKISKKNSINQKGTNNSQFGTMWITNGTENKKIKTTDPIPEYWVKGRKIKK